MKFLLILFFSLMIFVVNAQDIQGKIRYKFFVDVSKDEAILKDPSIDLARKKEVENNIKSKKEAFEHEYTLLFNKYESFYKMDEQLLPQDSPVGREDDDYYKNLKENIYVSVRDISGNIYLVSEKLQTFNWKLINETKTIGKYNCQKAYFSEEVDDVEQVKGADGSFEQKTVKRQQTTTAWYTTQIPIMNGPREFGGLPGLILELSVDLHALPYVIKCTEISINPQKNIKIKRPTAKKLYTVNEYKMLLQKLISDK